MYKWKLKHGFGHISSLSSSFKSRRSLNCLVYSNLRLFSCNSCLFSTNDQRRIIRHKCTRESLRCIACKRDFISPGRLASHVRTLEHEFHIQSLIYLTYLLVVKRQQRQNSDEEYYFKCKLCNYQSRTLRELIENHHHHYRSILGDNNDDDDEEKNNRRRLLSKRRGNQIKQLMSFMFGLVKLEKINKKFDDEKTKTALSSIRDRNEITNCDYYNCLSIDRRKRRRRQRLNDDDDDFISRELIDFNKSIVLENNYKYICVLFYFSLNYQYYCYIIRIIV